MSEEAEKEEVNEDIFLNLSPEAKHLVQYAEVGNPEYMVEVGDNFRNGNNGFPQNDEYAVKYYKLAADFMNEDGLVKYATMLMEGIGIEPDLYLAKRIFNSIPKTSKHFSEAREAKQTISHSLFIEISDIPPDPEEVDYTDTYKTGKIEATNDKVIIAKSSIPLIVMDVDLCRFFELATPPLFLKYFGETKNGYDRNCVWGPINHYYTLRDAILDELHGKKHSNRPIYDDTTKSKIVFAIAVAMSNLHSFGIWHCDLNPINVYLTENNEPMLYNMCYSMQSLKSNKFMEISYDTPVGHSMNRLFWSPELLITVGAGFRPSYDVYSFSIILYTMFNHYKFLSSNGTVIDPSNAMKTTLLDVKEIVKDGNRYECIPGTAIPDFALSLIRSCWRADNTKRPTFEDIVCQLISGPPLFEKTNIEEYRNYQQKLISSQQQGGQK